MNETIQDIIREMRDEVRMSRENNPDPRTRVFLTSANMALEDFADRLEAAYTREFDELKGERKGILKANESLAADNTRLRGELAEKDAEIARIKSVLSELFKRTLTKCQHCDGVCDECYGSLSDLVPLIKWSLEGVPFDPNDYSNLPLFKKEVK